MQKKPVHKVHIGAITINIWENETADGKKYRRLSFERIYKQGGEWKKTATVRVSDIPLLIEALNQAWKWCFKVR